MKKQIFSFLLLLLCVFSVSAQESFTSVTRIDSTLSCDALRNVIDNIFIRLQQDPQRIALLIYYEGKYNVPIYRKGKFIKINTVLPAHGEAEARIQAIRDHIRVRRYDSTRVWFINGGYREEFEIEPWIFPKNMEFPTPTPSLDKIQFREGKPLDFACNYD